jgi:hypothetical protein
MGNFRFYRRLHIFPGLSLNLCKSGPSVTVGMRGAHLTLGRSGVTRTVGIPGTGLYYTSRSGHHTGLHSAHSDTPIDSRTQARAESVGILGMRAITLAIVLGIGMLIGYSISH